MLMMSIAEGVADFEVWGLKLVGLIARREIGTLDG